MVGGLYRHRKGENKKFSLAYICRRAGMPSKGYLSDVINGRRQLHEKFARGLADAFELSGEERKIFLLTVEKEKELSPNKQLLLQKRIQALRDHKKSGVSLPSFSANPVLFTRLFCALGLFTKPPTRQRLAEVFRGENEAEVHAAIEQLVRSGAVKEAEGKLTSASSSIMFGSEKGVEANVRYIQSFLQHSAGQVPKWYARKSESYIESSVVSVKRETYLAMLPKMKEFFDSAMTEAETAEGADDLVYFNIQVYPERGGS